MANLLEIRAQILNIFRKNESLIIMGCKFLMVLILMLLMDAKIGYCDMISGPLFAVIVALIGSLIPLGFTAGIFSVLVIAEMYYLSLEAAAVAAVIALLLFFIYFRFDPKDVPLLFLSQICYAAGIPYVIPVAGGLLYNPFSAVTVAFGALIHHFLKFVVENETSIGGAGEDSDTITKFRFIIDGMMKNRAMMVSIAAFAVAVIVVYTVRRLVVRQSWRAANLVGCVLQLVIILIGDIAYDININIALAFIGVVFSMLIGEIITFFVFNLDYSRTEDTQFEDADYYYYVKAVPKVSVARPNRKVKQINLSRHMQGPRPETQEDEEEYEEVPVESEGYDTYDDYEEDDADPYGDEGDGTQEY